MKKTKKQSQSQCLKKQPNGKSLVRKSGKATKHHRRWCIIQLFKKIEQQRPNKVKDFVGPTKPKGFV